MCCFILILGFPDLNTMKDKLLDILINLSKNIDFI